MKKQTKTTLKQASKNYETYEKAYRRVKREISRFLNTPSKATIASLAAGATEEAGGNEKMTAALIKDITEGRAA